MVQVKIFIYDLSRGMARQLAPQFIGRPLDGVWHTSIVLDNNVEIFYGHGIQEVSPPGTSHHGQPLEVVDMGTSQLSMDVIQDYIVSLGSIYTPDKYNLFEHNCNNFTQDMCQFLVGKDIPRHITDLPKQVLDTPFGQMLRPMLDQAFTPIATAPSVKAAPQAASLVNLPSSLSELEDTIRSQKAVIVFFTSSTCGPCRAIYPLYDELAAQNSGKVTFVKVDIGKPNLRPIASKYSISATPTFYTFANGTQVEEWKGADVGSLKSGLTVVIYTAYPPHPHEKLALKSAHMCLSKPKTVYIAVPDLTKLSSKLDLTTDTALRRVVEEMTSFIKSDESKGPIDTPTVDINNWAQQIQSHVEIGLKSGSVQQVFPLIDLLRICCKDLRISSWFLQEKDLSTLRSIVSLTRKNPSSYPLVLVTLQLACNLSYCPLFKDGSDFSYEFIEGILEIASSQLHDEPEARRNVRIAALSFIYNLAATKQERKDSINDAILESAIVTIVTFIASLQQDAIEYYQLALPTLFSLLYMSPIDGVAITMAKGLETSSILQSKQPALKSNRELNQLLNDIIRLVT